MWELDEKEVWALKNWFGSLYPDWSQEQERSLHREVLLSGGRLRKRGSASGLSLPICKMRCRISDSQSALQWASRDKVAQRRKFPKSCPTLCEPMDGSMPGFPVFHYLPVCSNSCALSWWHYLTISSSALFSFCRQSSPASGSFLISRLFTSGGQSIGGSASASVLPMNIQDWFPLGWTGLISLQSKGLSRVFSNTTVGVLHHNWSTYPTIVGTYSCSRW